MRVGYLVHFRGGMESGILRKVASQAAMWRKLGADVGLFVATSPAAESAWSALPAAVSVRMPPGGPLALLREREALIRDVERWRPDVVYLRHGLVHPGLIRLARRLPCVIEVNGDDLAEFRLSSKRRYLLARATRGLLLRRAAGLVFVTRELAALPSFARYQRPSVVVANGIDLASVESAPVVHNERTRVFFIGHPDTPWHGLDHIAELAGAFPGWQFDVVGPRAKDFGCDPPANVLLHGPLEPIAYAPMLGVADLAVGTLGLYRKHMEEASPLKVREYLAAGIPILIGYQDTDFPDGAPFILRVANAPEGVRNALEAIRAFVEAWQGQRIPRSAVGHLDASVKEGARLQFIEASARG
jgi:hypothetical protein